MTPLRVSSVGVVASVLLILVLLRDFDKLKFFEGTIGTNSAKDVLGILEGTK